MSSGKKLIFQAFILKQGFWNVHFSSCPDRIRFFVLINQIKSVDLQEVSRKMEHNIKDWEREITKWFIELNSFTLFNNLYQFIS